MGSRSQATLEDPAPSRLFPQEGDTRHPRFEPFFADFPSAETGTHPSHAGQVIKDEPPAISDRNYGLPRIFRPEAGNLAGARNRAPEFFRQTAETVAGSTFTPAPCVDEMAIFLR